MKFRIQKIHGSNLYVLKKRVCFTWIPLYTLSADSNIEAIDKLLVFALKHKKQYETNIIKGFEL